MYLGTDYRLGDFIIINENLAIKIVQIFVSQQEVVAALTGLKHSIRFYKDLHMFKIIEALEEDNFLLSSFKYPSINVLKYKQNLYLKNKSF